MQDIAVRLPQALLKKCNLRNNIAVRVYPKPYKRNASVIPIPTLRHKQRPATLHSPYSMTTKTDIPSSSSSSPPFRKLTYDVFLSFRGEDTRKNFTDHLYSALKQKGIFTFRDHDELERGELIAPNLVKAIEESRYAVVVFSRNYANSSWCLDEIAKIVECKEAMGQKVLPVFYDVDPYEVRHQTGEHLRKAFAKHQERFEGNPDKVQRWKAALSQLANLSGWHVKDGYESKVIGEIVEKIFTELNQRISISEGLVGMDSHLKKVLAYLDIEHPDVRIIGICGLGGIGKTTIAHMVSQRVKVQFEGNCFLENIREVIEKQGPVHLQEQLLSNLLKSNVHVQDIEMGKNIIKDRLCTKRVLIVLDDVDQDEQLEALCDREWFGPGSRIIITSRDEHLLSAVEGDEIYKVNSLSDEAALQLFRMKAFKKDQLVGEEFLKLSKEFLKYAGGHPLAINVLGSSVKGRSVELWSSALDRLKHIPEKKTINVFKFSFEGLRDTEKEVFLDIACFFKGEDKDRVTRVLKGCDGPNIDIEVLIEKSLVTLFGRKLWMHDLIQTMGREIVRQQYPRKPEKCSWLWDPEEIIHVLDRSKATSAIQGIWLQGRPTKDNVVHSINDSFSNMDRLRVLKVNNVKFSGNIKYLSNKLQYLDWNECPIDSFPPDFQPDNLVELLMFSSRIKQLWRGEKGWGMLRLINLWGSQYLTSTPDFTEVPELEILVLQDCTSLVEVHPSLGSLKKLFVLNMRNCKSVECIPPFTSLESLKTLNLSLCSRLKRVPEIEGNMKSLLELYLGGTSIEELPPSVECLTGLTTLDLTDCKNLLHLPSTIQCLTSLKILNLTGCSKLEEIPKNQHCMECLEELYIGGTAITDLSFLVDMKNLQHLSCPGCKGLLKGHADPTSLLPPASLTCLIELDLSDCDLMDGAIPNDLSSLISLERLDLSGNNFLQLPDSIAQLSKLETLELFNCKQLQLLPELPSSCRYVHAQGCTSLTDFPNQSKELISVESGVTTINSLDSAERDSQHFVSWRFGEGQNARIVRHTNDYTEWKQVVDYLPLPLPISFKDLELSNRSSQISSSILGDDEIPEWFRTISTSNPISISIPPNLTDDNKWKGVAVCAVFVSTQGTRDFRPKKKRKVGHTTTAVSVIDESDSETCNYLYQCTLQTDVVLPMQPSVIGWERRDPYLLMISYVASSVFPKRGLNESTVLAARFETNNPFMVVHKCGIRLVYEQDAGWHSIMSPFVDPIFLNEARNYDVLESGWLSQDQVDKRWKWEKFIPPMDEASTLVLRKNIESVLPRYLEAVNHHSETYEFSISGSPPWFDFDFVFDSVDTIMPAGSWSSHSIVIPQNLNKNKKWMGFAIYASIAEGVGHIIRQEEEDNYCVYFHLTTGGESHKTVSRELEYIRSSEEHHQLLVVYIPRAKIPEALFTRTSSTTKTEMEISFMIDSPYVKFQLGGFRVVYQEDIQGLVETIIQCMQKEGSLEFYDKLVVENWIKLIRLQGGHLEGMSNPKERDPRTRWEKKFELLSQKYRNWDWSTPRIVQCEFWGYEISEWKWFMHFEQGNSAEIQLPPNLFDDANWLGIAVCAFNKFSHEDPNLSVGSSTPDLEYNVLTCLLDSDVDWAGLHDIKYEALLRKIKPWGFACNKTVFVYIPRGVKCNMKHWRQCNLARATFSSSSPCVAVHSCALGLLYKKDVECLVQTLTSCDLPSPVSTDIYIHRRQE